MSDSAQGILGDTEGKKVGDRLWHNIKGSKRRRTGKSSVRHFMESQ